MTHLLTTIVAVTAILGGSTLAPQAQDRRTGGGAALAALGSQFSARVVAVADGDTIEVTTSDDRRVRIRLEGIDCPERGEPFSTVARNFTRQLAFDRTVRVDVRDVDRYGRLVARVTSEGKDLSVELVSAGFASHYTVFSFDSNLEAAEQRAQRERLGMWVNGAGSSPAGSSPVTRKNGGLKCECFPNGSFVLSDVLADGWRVGPQTGCYIRHARVEWYDTPTVVRLSVFPVASRRSLRAAPELKGRISTPYGVSWMLHSGRVENRIQLLRDDVWKLALNPKLAGLARLRLYHEASFACDSLRVRVQLLILLDMSSPRRDLVWWERFGTISGGLPSLGKKRSV